jgi:NitT/TauT family transport system substrate-binding protein
LDHDDVIDLKSSWSKLRENHRQRRTTARHTGRETMTQAIRLLLALLLVTAARPAAALETVTVASLPLTSAGAMVVARTRGYFTSEGLEVRPFFSQAAQDSVMAVASGSADIGVGSFTAGFYNLAGKGAFRIIGGQSREVPGFRNNGFMVSDDAWDHGLRSLKDLPGHRVGITTTGGGLHYAVGLLGRKYGYAMNQLTLVPMQNFPNLVAAFKGGQLDVMAAASGVMAPLVAQNVGHVIGWSGDETPWQLGAVFVRPVVLQTSRPMLLAFLRGYRRGCADYHAAMNATDETGKPTRGADHDAMVALLAEQLQTPPAAIEASVAYIPADCALDVADVRNQIRFWQQEGLLDPTVSADAMLDMSLTHELDAGHL